MMQQTPYFADAANQYGQKVMAQKQAAEAAAKSEKQRLRDALMGQGNQSAALATYGQQGFMDRARINTLLGQLGDRASGKDSMSAEQLRQGLGQQLAQQNSMVAGARPGNQAMAARTGMMNTARLGAGLSGQTAMAGIAERQAAQNSLGQMLGQLRGQDLQAALGAAGLAQGAYGTLMTPEEEKKNKLGMILGGLAGGGLGFLAGGPAGIGTGAATGAGIGGSL